MTHDWILFLTHAWEGIVSGPWLLSGQRRALFTAVQQSDRCWHCCLRSRLCLVATWLLEGHVGDSRGIIILKAGLNQGSQRTFRDHMMLWRWSPWPLCLCDSEWGLQSPNHHKINVANIWTLRFFVQQTTGSKTVLELVCFCKSCAQDYCVFHHLF